MLVLPSAARIVATGFLLLLVHGAARAERPPEAERQSLRIDVRLASSGRLSIDLELDLGTAMERVGEEGGVAVAARVVALRLSARGGAWRVTEVEAGSVRLRGESTLVEPSFIDGALDAMDHVFGAASPARDDHVLHVLAEFTAKPIRDTRPRTDRWEARVLHGADDARARSTRLDGRVPSSELVERIVDIATRSLRRIEISVPGDLTDVDKVRSTAAKRLASSSIRSSERPHYEIPPSRFTASAPSTVTLVRTAPGTPVRWSLARRIDRVSPLLEEALELAAHCADSNVDVHLRRGPDDSATLALRDSGADSVDVAEQIEAFIPRFTLLREGTVFTTPAYYEAVARVAAKRKRDRREPLSQTSAKITTEIADAFFRPESFHLIVFGPNLERAPFERFKVRVDLFDDAQLDAGVRAVDPATTTAMPTPQDAVIAREWRTPGATVGVRVISDRAERYRIDDPETGSTELFVRADGLVRGWARHAPGARVIELHADSASARWRALRRLPFDAHSGRAAIAGATEFELDPARTFTRLRLEGDDIAVDIWRDPSGRVVRREYVEPVGAFRRSVVERIRDRDDGPIWEIEIEGTTTEGQWVEVPVPGPVDELFELRTDNDPERKADEG